MYASGKVPLGSLFYGVYLSERKLNNRSSPLLTVAEKAHEALQFAVTSSSGTSTSGPNYFPDE